MRTYDVSCYDEVSGKVKWSGTWEANNPSEAIAEASLPPAQRNRFIRRIALRGLDELLELTVDHPGADMGRWLSIRASEVTP